MIDAFTYICGSALEVGCQISRRVCTSINSEIEIQG